MPGVVKTIETIVQLLLESFTNRLRNSRWVVTCTWVRLGYYDIGVCYMERGRGLLVTLALRISAKCHRRRKVFLISCATLWNPPD